MIREPSERHPVDRLAEEFVARYRGGERPSISEYAQRYPDLAGELQELITALVLMEQHGPAGSGADVDDETDLATSRRIPDQLGEYRILREIGRGGMGFVYEAVQESLGRHVALKVLPSATLMDPTRLKRFQREVQAAAKLHHTNIVPVFGVGESDGIRYYAMQFIAGRGLDKVIDELRELKDVPRPRTLPVESGSDGEVRGSEANTVSAELSTQSDTPRYYRSVARLGEQVAEALTHAHRQGILHRDIKPGNLLLDAEGTVWVTDFGLAKAEGMEELTHTGDIVGTLRYMAPERFQGQGDARADVYSLGLTLYELLTLRPAFDAPDRAALVRQIAQDSPPRPRKLDPRIPRDLETIVLKACAKEPSRRYGTASALAEDLRRFLGDRPIEARRTAWSEHAWRWCRRNPGIAAASAAAVAALLIGLGVSLWQWRRAEDNFAAMKKTAEELERAERQTRIEANQAEAHYRWAWGSMNDLLDGVGDWIRVNRLRGPDAARRTLLERALALQQEYLAKYREYPGTRLDTARSALRVGIIKHELGDPAGAEEAYRQALGILESLGAEKPNEHAVREQLANTHMHLGNLLNHSHREDQAASHYDRALGLSTQLENEFPEQIRYRSMHARLLFRRGQRCLRAGRLPAAEADLRDAVRLQRTLIVEVGAADRVECKFLQMGNLAELGECLITQGKHQEALTSFNEGVALGEELLAREPRTEALVAVFVRNAYDSGACHYALKDFARAAEAMGKSVEYLRWLAEHAEDRSLPRMKLGSTLASLAAVLNQSKKLDEADAMLSEALRIAETGIRDEPHLPDHRKTLRMALVNQSSVAGARKDHAALVRLAERFRTEAALDRADARFLAAAMYCRCWWPVREDQTLSSEKRDQLHRQHADLAVACLDEAIKAGFADVQRLQSHTEFQILKDRADYQKLVAELEARAKAGRP